MRVYAVTGVPPEIQAYAMAKYSRSAQSMGESIGELSIQRAEQFLDTFYFAYGHRSIADLAHLALAIEDVSILAAIAIVDEQVWDGQERSTRYQDFRKSGYITPTGLPGADAEAYRAAADGAFASYHRLGGELLDALLDSYPAEPGADTAAHRRTLRARAFDVARYLLPLATRTSVGQITSARVLERQIARLLADPLAEVRAVGEALRTACREPARDVSFERVRAALGDEPLPVAVEEALTPPPLAPTLVKYADASPYAGRALAALAHAARTYLGGLPVERSHRVELANDETAEEEMVATLLFRADAAGHSYRQVQAVVREMSSEQRAEVIGLSLADRGQYDGLLREHQSGYALKFDILIDAGAFRDLHRHRRCVQVMQPFGPDHGHDDARETVELGMGLACYSPATSTLARSLGDGMQSALDAVSALQPRTGEEANYLLPMGARVRTLFKMDVAQAAYMIELRTGVTGHFSYRRTAWEMWEALHDRFPALATHIRATDPRAEVDLLRR